MRWYIISNKAEEEVLRMGRLLLQQSEKMKQQMQEDRKEEAASHKTMNTWNTESAKRKLQCARRKL